MNAKCPDPDCVLVDPNHSGPHMVAPGSSRLTERHPRIYVCSRCGYQFWDAAYGDVEAHWAADHVLPSVERLAEALDDGQGVMDDKAGLFAAGKRDATWFAVAILAALRDDR